MSRKKIKKYCLQKNIYGILGFDAYFNIYDKIVKKKTQIFNIPLLKKIFHNSVS